MRMYSVYWNNFRGLKKNFSHDLSVEDETCIVYMLRIYLVDRSFNCFIYLNFFIGLGDLKWRVSNYLLQLWK